MDAQAPGNLNRRDRWNDGPLSLSGIEEKIGLPNFLNGNLTNVQAGNFQIFKRDPDSIFKSLLFGIPILYIAIIGSVVWLIKRK
jgi:hypothetical protein